MRSNAHDSAYLQRNNVRHKDPSLTFANHTAKAVVVWTYSRHRAAGVAISGSLRREVARAALFAQPLEVPDGGVQRHVERTAVHPRRRHVPDGQGLKQRV